MKSYRITTAKEPVASFTMDYKTFISKFECGTNLVRFILNSHPEYKDLPYDIDFPDDDIVVTFLSMGQSVIEEA